MWRNALSIRNLETWASRFPHAFEGGGGIFQVSVFWSITNIHLGARGELLRNFEVSLQRLEVTRAHQGLRCSWIVLWVLQTCSIDCCCGTALVIEMRILPSLFECRGFLTQNFFTCRGYPDPRALAMLAIVDPRGFPAESRKSNCRSKGLSREIKKTCAAQSLRKVRREGKLMGRGPWGRCPWGGCTWARRVWGVEKLK